jgi:4-amino-4-deoxy-L-arabinose transferase-like glycosyltransferase
MQTPQRWIILAIIATAATTLAVRLHNAFVWNPWWGYDGGAHLAYSVALAKTGHLPSMSASYVAWHEPFFYMLTVPFLALPNLLPTLFGIATLGLCVFWLWRWTRHPTAVLLFLVLALGLPVVHTSGLFFSNEGLVHLLLLTALFLLTSERWTADIVDPRSWSGMTHICVGVFLGLALLTKLTAFLGVLTLLVWYGWRALAQRRTKPLLAVIATCAIAILVASPWFLYKTKTFGGIFANPYETGRAQETLPAHFFTSFDKNIFFSPFWPAGSNSFWSVAFAGTVTDYDGLLQNPDVTTLARDTVPSGINRVVTRAHAKAAQRAIFLGTCLAPLFLFATMRTIRRVWRERKQPSGHTLITIFIAGSLAALAFNIWRFPSLERGNLKPIFIFSAVVLSVFLTAEAITDPTLHPRLRNALTWYAGILGTLFAINGVVLSWI